MKIIAHYCNHQTRRLTVLTMGHAGDYAAYEGYNVSNQLSVEIVARVGDKISRERAESLFGDFITSTSIYRD